MVNFLPYYPKTTALRLNSVSERVEYLKEDLISLGFLKEDLSDRTLFDEDTRDAVLRFQAHYGLVVDGIAGSDTFTCLHSLTFDEGAGYLVPIAVETDTVLTQSSMQKAADELGVSVAAMAAVAAVESNGSGFGSDNKSKILFERHIMYRQLRKRSFDPDKYQGLYPNVVNSKPGGYVGGSSEYKRLALAASIDSASAYNSASIGKFQIMGFHWAYLDFDSVYSMWNHSATAAGQLDLFVRFIKADPRLHKALIDLDWPTFARIYNGPNYSKYKYDEKLAFNYSQISELHG